MPRSDGGTTFDELTRADNEAAKLANAWGWKPEVTLVKVQPCQWKDCGGSVLCFSGEARCLLCCRPPAMISSVADSATTYTTTRVT